QCKARGWDDLARALLERGLDKGAGILQFYSSFYQPPNLPPHTTLAYMAWTHWANELVKPDTDRSQIARRMKELLDGEPRLDNEGNRTYLKCLQAALVPSNARPGSVEAMIDDLVEVSYNPDRTTDYDPDPRIQRLADAGFAAVPALIEHVDD